MDLHASPPHGSKRPMFYERDLTWIEAQKLRSELISEGYRYVTIKTKLIGAKKEVSQFLMAKMQHVQNLVNQGGKIEGDLITFPDCIHVGYGEAIKQILNTKK